MASRSDFIYPNNGVPHSETKVASAPHPDVQNSRVKIKDAVITSMENLTHDTFLLTVKINKAIKRLKKRKNLNRYDKFPKKFYIKAQRDFIRIAKKNKKKYIILDSSENNSNLEKIIFKSLIKRIK